MTETLAPWHDFYTLVGGAAATLIGLLFVAASVGSSVFNHDRYPALRAFLSPSLVHLVAVLAASLLVLAPLRRAAALGALVGGTGGAGIVYAGCVWRGMLRYGLVAKIEMDDRLWYAALPPFAYGLMAGAGAALAWGQDAGCFLLAAAVGLLLLAAIRNAWDMTVWMVIRREN